MGYVLMQWLSWLAEIDLWKTEGSDWSTNGSWVHSENQRGMNFMSLKETEFSHMLLGKATFDGIEWKRKQCVHHLMT